MAQAFKFHTVISGRTLTLSNLGAFEGKRVEVIVMDDELSVPQAVPKRRFGALAGTIQIADDFDHPLPPDLQRYFEGDG